MAHRADQARSPDVVLTRIKTGPPPPRRRRTVIGVAVGAAVVAMIVGLVVPLIRDRADSTIATGGGQTNWNQTHRVDLPGGWQVTARNVSADEESTSLTGPDDHGCLVSVYREGVDPRHARPIQGERVSVAGGTEGQYGRLDKDFGIHPFGVVWSYQPRSWAAVSCDLDQAGILDMAERVRFEPNPMRLPFRLSGRPDQIALTDVIESDGDDRLRATLIFRTPRTPQRREQVMEISNLTDPYAVTPGEQIERRTINGHPVEIRPAIQMICFPTSSDPVCISGPGDEPAYDWSEGAREIALQTAELLTPVADPKDEDDWIDADQAIPPDPTRPGTTTLQRTAGNWNLIHRVELPDGWTLTDQIVSPQRESTSIRGPSPSIRCTVTVTGSAQPPEIPRGSREVRVHGEPAWYVALPKPQATSDNVDRVYPHGVFWEYQPGGWAQVDCSSRSVEEMVAMAERVEFVENPILMPFAVRDLPKGYEVQSVDSSREDGPTVVTANLSSPNEPAGQAQLAVTYGSFPSDGPSEKVKQGGRTVTLWPVNQKACLSTQADPICVTGDDSSDTTTWSDGRRQLLLSVIQGVAPVPDVTDARRWVDSGNALR